MAPFKSAFLFLALIIGGVTPVLRKRSTSSENNDPLASYHVIYAWKELDFAFPSEAARNRSLQSGEYIPANNVMTGIKVRGNRLYLTVPRWKLGVPATLTYVNFDRDATDGATGETKGPLLNPFPSWGMQTIGNCEAFQYIQSMEIDQFGRMWVIDVGRVFPDTSRTPCTPKLVIIDLNDGDRVVHTHEFPSDVVSPTTNFLNDLAVACENEKDCFAYISDAMDAKLVVYNHAENRSWFVHNGPSMNADPAVRNITILGKTYDFNAAIDGITVSPKDTGFNRIYYCPLTSVRLYSVSASVLRQAVNGDTLLDNEVKNEGYKGAHADGLAMDENGILYYGILEGNGVAYWNTTNSNGIADNDVLLIQNDVDLQWPDTFAFDESGYLYAVSNKLQDMLADSYDFSDYNFRVVRTYTGSRSYMYSAAEQKKMDQSQTISAEVYDATPKTNQDDTLKKSPQDAMDNSSSSTNSFLRALTKLDAFTATILLIILVTFTLHPQI